MTNVEGRKIELHERAMGSVYDIYRQDKNGETISAQTMDSQGASRTTEREEIKNYSKADSLKKLLPIAATVFISSGTAGFLKKSPRLSALSVLAGAGILAIKKGVDHFESEGDWSGRENAAIIEHQIKKV